jgi:sec-independent protein translocase protein TatA
MTALAFINDLLHPSHLLVLLVFGLLIFGRRLPEVGRNVGRSIVEFKKGLKGIDEEVNEAEERQRRRDAERDSSRDGRGRDPYVDDRPRAPLQSGSSGSYDARPREGERVAPRDDARDSH